MVIPFRLFLASAIFIGLTADTVRAQSDGTLTFGGLVQAETDVGWFSRSADDQSHVGFGLRRTRLRASVSVGPRAGAFMHLIADNGDFGVLDAFAYYDASPHVRIRIGRMAGAQPRAFILTPVMLMDALDRAAIALRWNAGTLGTFGRDFGVDVAYNTDRADLMVFLHNGDGSFARLRGNFQPNILGDVTQASSHSLKEMALSAYGAYRPPALRGVELGGFVGVNGNRNPSTEVNGIGRRYASYSAHAYWGAVPGSQRVRVKADLVGIRYESISERPVQNAIGISLLGAVAVHRAAELFARAETFDPDMNQDDDHDAYVSAGVSFSTSKLRGEPYARERITLGYGLRLPADDTAATAQLISLQLQVFF